MSEATAVEREQELVRLRRRMGRALRRGESAEFEAATAEYAAAKAEHSAASDAEMKAVMRARRVRERAQVAAVAPRRWRLPPGFGRSPLAQQRDRSGRPREEPRGPEGGLRPWRRYGGAMSDVIWRP